MKNKGDFGERLKGIITRSEYSAKDLARMVGVSQNQMTRYVQNKAIPPSDKLERLASCLHVSMDYLWAGQDLNPQAQQPSPPESVSQLLTGQEPEPPPGIDRAPDSGEHTAVGEPKMGYSVEAIFNRLDRIEVQLRAMTRSMELYDRMSNAIDELLTWKKQIETSAEKRQDDELRQVARETMEACKEENKKDN